MTWREAKAKLGTRDRVKLENHTYLERRGDKAIAVRFHDTDVVTITPRWTELDSGGWHTMSSAARIRSYAPCDLWSTREGWQLVMVNPDKPCYCMDEDRRLVDDGIVVLGTYAPGMALRYTGEKTKHDDADAGRPIYQWTTCQHCQGSGVLPRADGERMTPYFDGVRVHPSGTRLMAGQPRKPKAWQAIITVSGWTGMTRGESMASRRVRWS